MNKFLLEKLEKLQTYSCHAWQGEMVPNIDDKGEWLHRSDVMITVGLYAIPPGFTLVADRHFNALAEGMAEIYATHRGESDQPIGDIIEHVLKEIEASKSPVQGGGI